MYILEIPIVHGSILNPRLSPLLFQLTQLTHHCYQGIFPISPKKICVAPDCPGFSKRREKSSPRMGFSRNSESLKGPTTLPLLPEQGPALDSWRVLREVKQPSNLQILSITGVSKKMLTNPLEMIHSSPVGHRFHMISEIIKKLLSDIKKQHKITISLDSQNSSGFSTFYSHSHFLKWIFTRQHPYFQRYHSGRSAQLPVAHEGHRQRAPPDPGV